MEAKRDQNRVPTLLGVSSGDGTTPAIIKANPAGHTIMVDDNTTGADLGPADSARDENRVPTLMAVSSLDGVTPVALYVDDLGQLLIQST